MKTSPQPIEFHWIVHHRPKIPFRITWISQFRYFGRWRDHFQRFHATIWAWNSSEMWKTDTFLRRFGYSGRFFFFLHRDFKLKVWSDSYVMAPCHCWHYLLNIWIWKMFLHRFAPFASCCWNRWSWWSCSVRLSFRYKVDGDAVASVHQNSDNIFPASGSNHFTAINFSFIQINWT